MGLLYMYRPFYIFRKLHFSKGFPTTTPLHKLHDCKRKKFYRKMHASTGKGRLTL